MGFSGLCDALLQVGYQLPSLFGFSDGLGRGGDDLAPGVAPGNLLIGDGGRDLAQGVVLLLGHAGEQSDDQIGFGCGDGLGIDAV